LRLVVPLGEAWHAIGAKAEGLVHASGSGARVPEGFVVCAIAYQMALSRVGGPFAVAGEADLERAATALRAAPLDAALAGAVEWQVARVGADRWSVRSSALGGVEDAEAASGAGVFESCIEIATDGLSDAIRAVWASVWSLPAYAYLHDRGRTPADVAMAVLVHRFIAGTNGTVFTRDPSAADSPWMRIETAAPARSTQVARDAPTGPSAELAQVALALEAAAARPLDIEWVQETPGGALYVLQQRPITAFAPAAFGAAPPDDSIWRLDAEHNPEPLSPAQAGLVALTADLPGLRQCVLDGFLYYTRERARAVAGRLTPDQLVRSFYEDLVPEIEALLTPLEQRPPALDAALVGYRAFCELYAELTVQLGSARAALAHLDPRLLSGTPTETTARDQALWAGDAALVRARWGALAPAWDVALPTFAEALPAAPRQVAASPEQRRAAAAARAAELERALPPDLRDAVATARALHAIGEADDVYFARAQWLVRRALLARGAAPDIFFVPLGAPADANVARAARREHERQRRLVPPQRFERGAPVFAAPTRSAAVLRGLGTGGRVRGRVGSGPGEVWVVSTLLPQLTVGIIQAAAVVTDHGALLSHGATQAREYGVPAVLGTGHATRALHAGDEVVVDADVGAVYVMARARDDCRRGPRR
jgi:pyruvate,water dikinase